MTTIHAHDLQPGDVIEHLGQRHVVRHVDRLDGWAWPVAFDDAGWALALGDGAVLVDRTA
jgi:hypothetical protein